MKKSTKKGFTLVELVIVIAVIAILSAILIPTFGNVISNANETKYQSGAKAGYEEVLANNISDYPEISDYDVLVIYFDSKIDTGTTVENATRAYLANGGNLTVIEDGTETTVFGDVKITVSNKKPSALKAGSQNVTTITAWPTGEDPLIPNNKLYKVNDNVAVLFYKAA